MILADNNNSHFRLIAFSMRRFYIIICTGLLLLFALCGDASMRGAVKGLELFAHGVFPALFPFTVCIGCLKRLGAFAPTGRAGFLALLKLQALGAIAGNPTGALLLGAEGSHGEAIQNREEGSVYAALFNLASPVFILGAVGSRIFGFSNRFTAIYIMLCHYFSAALLFCVFYSIGRIGRGRGNKKTAERRPPVLKKASAKAQTASLFTAFPEAAAEAASTMLKLCGIIVFFVSIGEIMGNSPLTSSLPLHPVSRAALMGMLEITNGLALLSAAGAAPRLCVSLACYIISFGGLCIFMQARSVCEIDAPAYLSAKAAHAMLAFLISYICFPLFCSFDALPAGVDISGQFAQRTLSVLQIALLCVLSSITVSLAAILAARKTRA